MHIHTYTHTHTHLCFGVYLSAHILKTTNFSLILIDMDDIKIYHLFYPPIPKNVLILISPIPIQYHSIYSILCPFLICNFFAIVKNPALQYLQNSYLFFQSSNTQSSFTIANHTSMGNKFTKWSTTFVYTSFDFSLTVSSQNAVLQSYLG